VSIPSALADVRANIDAAARAAGRDPAAVQLVAVSKTHPSAAIREAYAAGQRDFGENYVQELVQKAQELSDLKELRWHLIGHLQRNKARHVASLLALLHTVDSVELAGELSKRVEPGMRLPVLVEVSIAGEEQKHGVAPGELGALLDGIESLPALALRGLMCVPPFTEDAADSRPHFERLQQLRERHGGAPRLPELSMGMSHDLPHAVAAGATLVRVGTAIFGARPPKV
jgi:pyridoxal phosphate enzyme (YggS family)